MSRIGKLAVAIPQGVKVTLEPNNVVTVEKGKNKLTKTFSPKVTITQDEHGIHVAANDKTKATNALHGLTRVLIANMVEGVDKGFKKTLILNNKTYKADQVGNGVSLEVRYSHPIVVKAPEGVTITVRENKATGKNADISPWEIDVTGIDKELVGQVAANIRAVRIPDPYHNYGIRYSDEVLTKKEGKSAGK